MRSFLYTEPLSWRKPGGSDRDHRPLYAALATEATASASSGLTAQPFRKRPTLTRADRRPTKGGRRLPAPRGLVLDGLLIRRLQGGLPPRPGLTRLAHAEQGVSGSTKRASKAEKRSRWALAPQGQVCQRSERAFFFTRPQWQVLESLSRPGLMSTIVPPALPARRDKRSANIPRAQSWAHLP